MKILLVGGAGFIGTAIRKRLVKLGYQVGVLDALLHDQPAPAGVDFHHSTILDLPALLRAAKGCDAIIHLASIAGVASVIREPQRVMDTCIEGTANVVEAALENDARLLYFSTSEVYGQHALNVGESDPTPIPPPGEARWCYAASKLAAEHMVCGASGPQRQRTQVFRIFNVYGPGQIGDGAVLNFTTQALEGGPIKIYGVGGEQRTWCYVDDCVDAVIAWLNRPNLEGGRVYNIGHPANLATAMDLALKIRDIHEEAGPQVLIKQVPRPAPVVEVRSPDIGRARLELDWQPKTALDDGLRKTYRYYKLRKQ